MTDNKLPDWLQEILSDKAPLDLVRHMKEGLRRAWELRDKPRDPPLYHVSPTYYKWLLEQCRDKKRFRGED